MTHQSTTIALNKLVAREGNVHKTNANEGIEELAASIAAHGLLPARAASRRPNPLEDYGNSNNLFNCRCICVINLKLMF